MDKQDTEVYASLMLTNGCLCVTVPQKSSHLQIKTEIAEASLNQQIYTLCNRHAATDNDNPLVGQPTRPSPPRVHSQLYSSRVMSAHTSIAGVAPIAKQALWTRRAYWPWHSLVVRTICVRWIFEPKRIPHHLIGKQGDDGCTDIPYAGLGSLSTGAVGLVCVRQVVATDQ